MRRKLPAAFLAVFAAAAVQAGSLFVLELKGGARVFALDRPVAKGRVVLFHRHPDGIYTSISAEEVLKIAPAGSADRTDRFQPGELMVLGGDIEGRALEGVGSPPEPPQTRPAYQPSDYGYGVPWGYGWGARPAPVPRPPPRAVPTTIGPNGFPILAPRGSPGSTPPPIGSNGFPIIAPRKD
jgi:hypothetical protein